MAQEVYDLSESTPMVGGSRRQGGCTRGKALLMLVVVLIVGGAVAAGIIFGTKDDDNGGGGGGSSSASQTASSYAELIKSEKIMVHLGELFNISLNNTNSRSVTTGYNASAAYVQGKLEAAGYTVETHPFVIPAFFATQASMFELNENNNSAKLTYGIDFLTMSYSGNGTAVGPLTYIPDSGNFGCDASDWSDAAGAIVIIPRGECSFYEKAVLAKANGAIGLLFSNYFDQVTIVNGQAKGNGPTDIVDLPMLALSGTQGETLIQFVQISDENSTITADITAFTRIEFENTFSLTADTEEGRSDRTIVVGSHLDSVDAGPGINDNGSGSATNLELALQLLASGIKPINKVRFAWWGAEELGLLGSTAYVAGLSDTDLDNISLNLNYDMLASPNFVRGVYDGKSANVPPNNFGERVANGSARIQAVFEERFTHRKLEYTLSDFNGRSDYGPFIAKNIPAGGLFTGAEVIKTVEQKKRFGGLAHAPYDLCYHKACDDLDNIDTTVLGEMADAAAYALGLLMMEPDLQGFLHDGPRSNNTNTSLSDAMRGWRLHGSW